MPGNVTLPHVTGSDVISRKSPGNGCRRPKTRVLSTFELLQGSNSQEVAVPWEEMTSRDRMTGSDPDVTSFNRKSPGSGCRRPIS